MTPRQQSDDLLGRSRQAMAEGRLDVAEKLIKQAESLKAKYNPLDVLAYTPAKARADLKRKQGPSRAATSVAADPFLSNPALMAGPAMATASDVRPLPSINVSQPGPGLVPQAQSPSRSLCDGSLRQSRRALAMGDVNRALKHLGESKRYPVKYGPTEDSPTRVEADIVAWKNLQGDKQLRKYTRAYNRKLVRLLMQQAEALLAWGDHGEAERLTLQAKGLRVDFGPMEKTPDKLLVKISNTRQGRPTAGVRMVNNNQMRVALAPHSKAKASGLTRQAREAFSAGDLIAAQAYAQAAVGLNVPESAFAPNEDRPSLVIQEIARAKGHFGGPIAQTAATNPVTPAVHHQAPGIANIAQPANYIADPRRPYGVRQTQALMNAPQVAPRAGNAAMTLFNRGEAALKAGNTAGALEYYRQAVKLRSQLDPMTAQRLQNKIQMLTTPGSTVGALMTEAVPSSMVREAVAKQQLLARQVNSDVDHQLRRSAQLQESEPDTALRLLEQARSRVEAAGLDIASRTAIIRRVDRQIAGLKQYILDNAAQLSLKDRNKAVLAQIKRERQFKLDTQQRIKELSERYNELKDQRKFAEAEVVAKEAIELDPDSSFATLLRGDLRFSNQFRENQRTKQASEAGFLYAMNSAERAAIPFDDSRPYQFPDPKEWKTISSSRAQLMHKLRRMQRSEKELEIEKRLKTSVSVSFRNEPLESALRQLADLAKVTITFDRRAFAHEGISPETPISIDLRDEVSFRSALNIILEQYELCYTIKNDALTITSDTFNDMDLYPIVYHVADLVVPIPNFGPNPNMGLAGAYNQAMQRCGFNGPSGFSGGAAASFGMAANTMPAGGMINKEVLAQMPQNTPLGGGGGGGGSMPTGFGPGGLGGGSNADFDSLIELITTTVDPDSWDDVGGGGSINEYSTNHVLVIRQTQEVHEEIRDLLEQLRRLQDLQVTIEVRFITLNDSFFERIGVDFDLDIDDDIDRKYQVFGRVEEGDDDDDNDDNTTSGEPTRNLNDVDYDRSVTVGMSAPGVFSADLDIPFRQGSFGLATPVFGGYNPAAGASMGFAILSDLEAFFFIQAATGDQRTNILQAPKVTLFNGQQAFVSDTSQSPFVISVIPVVGDFAAAQQPVIVVLSEGTFLTVQAVVSADRRFVRLTVIPFFSTIGDVDTFTFTGETTTTSDTSTEGSTVVPDDDTRENNIHSQTTLGTTVQLPTFSFVTVTTTVSVPDGGTVLLGGIKRLSEGRSEYGVPMLNQIPYLNRLFKNVGIGRDTQSLMMMVTPRIIIQEEEEERISVAGG